jgi:fibronectin type 3 domain-containing protein
MNNKESKLVFRLIYTFFISILFCGVMILSGCAVNSKNSVPARESYISNDSGIGQVTLTWKNVPDADSYNLYISKIPGAKNNGKKVSNAANPITIEALEIGNAYYFVVTAVDNGLESDASSEIKHVVER